MYFDVSIAFVKLKVVMIILIFGINDDHHAMPNIQLEYCSSITGVCGKSCRISHLQSCTSIAMITMRTQDTRSHLACEREEWDGVHKKIVIRFIILMLLAGTDIELVNSSHLLLTGSEHVVIEPLKQ